MNFSKKHRFIWWGTAGCGSRSTFGFLTACGCDDLTPANWDLESGEYTHTHGIPDGCEGFPIVCNVRNPYSKCVSTFLDETSDEGPMHNMPFDQWIFKLINSSRFHEDEDHFYMLQWDQGVKPDYVIRMENMEEDLRRIPFLPQGEKFEHAMKEAIQTNGYMNENPRDEYEGNFQKFQKYYTQEIADLVYEAHKEYFQLGGYDKNSWKSN